MHLIDPYSVAMRWMDTLVRREYHVTSPNALWHVDGNHKLIRWRMVIHGGTDSHSRIVVFLRCSTDNLFGTVLDAFTNAVQRYGLPSRVRTDTGGENIGISFFMLNHPARGPGMGSMIVGRSVHNQRIERLWCDLYYQTTC